MCTLKYKSEGWRRVFIRVSLLFFTFITQYGVLASRIHQLVEVSHIVPDIEQLGYFVYCLVGEINIIYNCVGLFYVLIYVCFILRVMCILG